MISRSLSKIALVFGLALVVVGYAALVGGLGLGQPAADGGYATAASSSEFLLGLYAPGYGRAMAFNFENQVEQVAPSVVYRSLYDSDLGAYVYPESSSAWPPGDAYMAPVPISCRVRAGLDAWYEEIGGATATLYELDFEALYTLRQETTVPTSTVELVFSFPAGLDTLNDVYFFVDGEEPSGVQYSLTGITWHTEIAPGEEHEVAVTYRARGAGSFRYAIDHNRRLEVLDVEIAVRGLTGGVVTEKSLAPSEVTDTEAGQLFAWGYDALIADRDLEVTLPTPYTFAERVQELQGPLRDLSAASPFLVGLFVLCLYGVSRLSEAQLSPHHYVLAGLGFFLFFPALTFLSAVTELPVAAAAAGAAVAALLVIFLGLSAGWRRTLPQSVLLCVVFLGLFSVGFISAARGLLFTTGALLLVADLMLLSAKHRATARLQPDLAQRSDLAARSSAAEPQ